jgi:hypothetical protein
MARATLVIEDINPLIRVLRGQRVILAADLAKLYGVETKQLNQQIKRNSGRFPSDFVFQLSRAEVDELKPLRSQNVTLKQGEHLKYRPYAFTEHGAIMAANVLNSRQATAMSVYIVRAFIQQREMVEANSTILKRLAEIDHTLLQHNAALRDIYQKLLPLLQPPPDPPRPKIGFREKSPRYGLRK